MKEEKNQMKRKSLHSRVFFSLTEPHIFHFIISLIPNADSIEEEKKKTLMLLIRRNFRALMISSALSVALKTMVIFKMRCERVRALK